MTAPASFLIAQLSDVHIRGKGERYKDIVDSNRMFSEAIEHLHALDRKPDLVILTGDLVDYGHANEYANAVELLSALTIPYLVMAGNHDSREQLRAAFASHRYLPLQGPLHYCIDDHPLRVVALDSTVPAMHHGAIDQPQLDWLRATLSANRLKPTIVLLHHPPFVSGIPYLDNYNYPAHNALAAVLGEFSNIEAVFCGHVHRTMIKRWAGTVVCACPSTTTQIALQLAAKAQPKSYGGPAACMLHYWTAMDGLVSHVSYVGDYPGPYPFF